MSVRCAAAVAEGLLSAQVGGIVDGQRGLPRYGAAASGGPEEEPHGYFEVGGRVRASYSRRAMETDDGTVIGRLQSSHGGGMMQMEMGRMGRY